MTIRDRLLNREHCPIIDIHGHMGPFHAFYMPDGHVDDMVRGMDRCGVESLVLSPHNALCGDTREGNRDMLEAVTRHPGRIYGYCTINPSFPAHIEDELDTYLNEPGVVGIKLHPAMHACPVDDPRYASTWERANAEKRLLLSHTWGAGGGCGSSDMRRIAERYPDVRLILGHSCYGDWDRGIAIAADFPNVYLDLTAAYHIYGVIERMCEKAGSHKVLFGTDYPWFDPSVTAGCVVYAHISEDDMANILYNNARRLLDEQLNRGA